MLIDDATFDKLGRAELLAIEEALADVDPDNVELNVSDGVLTLTLKDGVRVVINTHRAAKQIWMAAVASAWHFEPPQTKNNPEAAWCTADGHPLRPTLEAILARHAQVVVDLAGSR